MKSEFLLGFTCFPSPQRGHGDVESSRANAGADLSRCIGRFQALKQLQHPNLCRFLDLLIGRDHLLFVITEHASRTLGDALRACPQGLDEQLIVRAATQVTIALCYLNSQGVVHGHLEPESVLIDEDDRLKLTGHGLEYFMRHGRWAEYPLRARVSYWPPELAQRSSSNEHLAGASSSCKVDVWSLGVLILEMLHGPWRVDADDGSSADEAMAMDGYVRLETARVLRRYGQEWKDEELCLSAPALLGDGSLVFSELPEGMIVPPPSCFSKSEVSLRRVEESYRCWLSGRASARGGQDLRELWTACLAILPSHRPTPGDLASHPVLAPVGENPPLGAAALQWTECPALQCECLGPLLPPKELREQSAEESPLETLCAHGVEVPDLFYWWSLAGGDPFETVAEKHLLRPVPPIFRLPLLVRDNGGANADGALPAERCHALDFLDACFEVDGESSPPRHPRGVWGAPSGTVRPPIVGVDLRELVTAVLSAEKIGLGDAKSMRPASVYERHHHFSYQWLRVRNFQRLLLTMPQSRPDVFREAAEDVPPLLRPKIWAALLGADLDSDRGCWSIFYDRLLAAPLDRSQNDQRLVRKSVLCHELLNNPEGQERLDRLLHVVRKANPSLTGVDGIAALAAPLAVVYANSESVAFLALQRILHGFVWNFYADGCATHQQHCMHLFNALLRFADPQLELHLRDIGMLPDIYAGAWFSTWFALLLPLHQLLLLWDAILLRPPQFPLFVGVCLLHFFRGELLAMDDVSHMSSFLDSSAQLMDIALLGQASLALFEAVPSSVTLPLYPRHSAGDAMLSKPGSAGMTAVDPSWKDEGPGIETEADADIHAVAAREQLVQRAMHQYRQCDWWRQRAASTPTPPVITVDDLLSFRSRCFLLDVRTHEDFVEGHFQASVHVRDPVQGDLSSIVPQEVLAMGISRPLAPAAIETSTSNDNDVGGASEVAVPWLFAFNPAEDSPTLRVRLVVVIGGSEDFGATFAARLLSAGVRHVVCLLGGMNALWEDARSYLTTGAD